MNKFINSVNKSVGSFVKDEEGAQVVEYALIIAVVSIGLVIALGGSTGTGSLRAAFTALVARVNTCFTTTCA
jgi:pilus assembly protein Flp/PilA